MASGDLVPRIYSNFRGVDFRGEDINIVRSPDSLNMWKDYKEVDSIRTRPELEKIEFRRFKERDEPSGPFWGLHYYTDSNGKGRIYLHINKNLYMSSDLTEEGRQTLLIEDEMNEAPS